MDQETQNMLIELTSRVEVLENAVSSIADNIDKLEQLLDAIVKQVPSDESWEFIFKTKLQNSSLDYIIYQTADESANVL